MMDEKRSRHRLPISCMQCRRRKRRCDRQNPCQTCVHRGEGISCSYKLQKDSGAATVHPEVAKSDNQILKERIRRLEEIVQSYANKSSPSPVSEGPADDYTTQTSASSEAGLTHEILGPGVLSGSLSKPGDAAKHQGRYKSLTSWDSILRELDQVKIAVNDSAFDPAHPNEGKDLQKSIHSNGPFFAGSVETISDLFAYLPPRPRLDLLISRYFQSYHPFYPIIDPSTFWWRYPSFLADPDDFVMLSQIFGMLALACVNSDPDDLVADEYARLALRALQASEFLTTFTVATVVCLINIMFFYQRERFQQTFTWIIFGFALQMARALGLHRDPTHFGITGRECQIRRHVWISLLTQDSIHTARYGRTTIIDVDEWDTKSPEELTGTSPQDSSSVPTSYSHNKRIISISIAKVFKLLFRPRAYPSYQTILDVERDLKAAHASLPQYMKCNESDSLSEQASKQWMFCRFSPFVLAHTMIVIHRPFLLKRSAEFHHSRIVCLQSARELIEIVSELENAPGLEEYAWHVRELRNIAYLPAATLLCIGLHIRAHPEFAPLPQNAPVVDASADCELIERILDQLPTESHVYSVIGQLYSQVKSPNLPKSFVPADDGLSLLTGQVQLRDLDVSNNLAIGAQNEWNMFVSTPGAFGNVETPFAMPFHGFARDASLYQNQQQQATSLVDPPWQPSFSDGLADHPLNYPDRAYDASAAYWNDLHRRSTAYIN